MFHYLDQRHVNLQIAGAPFQVFNCEKHSLKGVGRHRLPFVNMDPYVDHSQDEALHLECCAGLARANEVQMSMVNGALPSPGETNWSEVYQNIEQYDPTGVHIKNLEKIRAQVPADEFKLIVFRYSYFAFGSTIPWFFSVFLKRNLFKNKTQEGGFWTEETKNFPLLTEYLKTLPFKVIGRVVFFTTWPGASVPVHRDSVVAEHKDHNINLFFEGGRKSFVWDELTDTRTYLDPTAKSYFFNNRDYHGVDPEPRFRYTLRIDGTFTDEMQEKLCLEGGYTWKWDYDRT